MTHRGPFQPLPFCDSAESTPETLTFHKGEKGPRTTYFKPFVFVTPKHCSKIKPKYQRLAEILTKGVHHTQEITEPTYPGQALTFVI